MKTYFIISLDTELHWGYSLYPHSKMAKILQREEDKAINAIEDLLRLFEKYNIPATWAVVGHLFLEHPEIIEKILSSSVEHEMGYHSFSHSRFSECTSEIAETEIQKGIELAKDYGITLKSFVFPENKIGHLDMLKKYGFQIYRGANLAGESINKSLPIRAINFAVSKIVSPSVEPIWRDGIWEIPSSMMFYDPLFPHTLVLRAKLGIEKAIKNAKIFHIFAHPEDLIVNPTLINKLEEVLKFVAKNRDENKLEVITMGELSSLLKLKERVNDEK